MSSSTHRDATVRRSQFTLPTTTTHLASDAHTPSLATSKSGSDHHSNQPGVNKSFITSSGEARRKARKTVPLSSEEDRPSTGSRPSLHRRTLETTRGSTDSRINYSKPSTSRKKLNEKLKSSSSCTSVAASRLTNDEPDDHVSSGVRHPPDIAIDDIDVDGALTTIPTTMPFNVSPAQSSCKNVEELWSNKSMFSPRCDVFSFLVISQNFQIRNPSRLRQKREETRKILGHVRKPSYLRYRTSL